MEDFDCYEASYATNIRDFFRENPEDADDASMMLERIDSWEKNYKQYGREILGFACFVVGRSKKDERVDIVSGERKQ